jgi:hypothetical protein
MPYVCPFTYRSTYVRLKLNEQRQGQGQGQEMTAAKF